MTRPDYSVGIEQKTVARRICNVIDRQELVVVRGHGTIKTTPAIGSGITDHVWTLEELLTAV